MSREIDEEEWNVAAIDLAWSESRYCDNPGGPRRVRGD
jgi:hypothetical protein